MTVSFHDLTAGTYLRILDAVDNVLEKGQQHCAANGIDLQEVVETRLADDMLPFRFQIVSVAHHSLGALRGIEAGVFQPPGPVPSDTYGDLQALVADARAGVAGYPRTAVEELAQRDLEFRIGERSIPFTAVGFALSFSLPNFYFHAATAYDILRMKGVPLGKRDFIGAIASKR